MALIAHDLGRFSLVDSPTKASSPFSIAPVVFLNVVAKFFQDQIDLWWCVNQKKREADRNSVFLQILFQLWMLVKRHLNSAALSLQIRLVRYGMFDLLANKYYH